jgi:hypothetical protein
MTCTKLLVFVQTAQQRSRRNHADAQTMLLDHDHMPRRGLDIVCLHLRRGACHPRSTANQRQPQLLPGAAQSVTCPRPAAPGSPHCCPLCQRQTTTAGSEVRRPRTRCCCHAERIQHRIPRRKPLSLLRADGKAHQCLKRQHNGWQMRVAMQTGSMATNVLVG